MRELIQLCEAFAAQVAATHESPAGTLGRLLVQRYAENPVVRRILAEDDGEAPARPRRRRSRGPTRYERLRNDLISAYHQNGRNLCAAAEYLNAHGIPVSRRWLSIWLDRWGES